MQIERQVWKRNGDKFERERERDYVLCFKAKQPKGISHALHLSFHVIIYKNKQMTRCQFLQTLDLIYYHVKVLYACLANLICNNFYFLVLKVVLEYLAQFLLMLISQK